MVEVVRTARLLSNVNVSWVTLTLCVRPISTNVYRRHARCVEHGDAVVVCCCCCCFSVDVTWMNTVQYVSCTFKQFITVSVAWPIR